MPSKQEPRLMLLAALIIIIIIIIKLAWESQLTVIAFKLIIILLRLNF